MENNNTLRATTKMQCIRRRGYNVKKRKNSSLATGTPTDPYEFQKTWTVHGSIFQYYMRGNVYLNGRHVGYLDKIATGTWNTMILPY